MKKFTDKEFEEFIRNQLYDYEQEPPAEVFHLLKKNVSPSQNLNLLKILGFSTIFLLVTFSTILLLDHNKFESNNNLIVENDYHKLDNNINLITPNKNEKNISNSKSSNVKIITPETNHHHKSIIAEKDNILSVNSNQKANSEVIHSTPLKEKPKYEVITWASTCKQWNGKAQIKCNLPYISFHWKELNVSKPTVENLKYGQYTVFAKNGDEIIDTIIVNIADSGSVKADFKVYDMVIGNEMITFTENLSLIDKKSWKNQKNISFEWKFGNEAIFTQAEPKYSFSKSGEYEITLIVKSNHGCIDSITKSYIIEIPLNFVEISNIFSPNGDGINDYFKPILYDMESVECTIFDRNGILIYEWKTLNGSWDGKIRNTNQQAAPGTYYYILKGKTKSGKQILHKGMVQLVL